MTIPNQRPGGDSRGQTKAPQADSSTPRLSEPPSTFASQWSAANWLVRCAVQAAIVLATVALVLFLIGVAQRTGWVKPTGLFGGKRSSQAAEGQTTAEKRYICPMMCTPPSSVPGRCPVCAMELVEAAADSGGDGISVSIEPFARRLVGIQTAVSTSGEMSRTIRTVGSIEFDQSRLSTISAYVDGRLEKMYADYVGVRVREGDDLALIYSPQLYSAQTEYVSSLEGPSSTRFQIEGNNLEDMAKENLSELGMTAEQIAALRTSRVPQSRTRIKSPQTGTVLAKAAVEGDYLKAGEEIYRIADLSAVWIMLDLFPDDAASIRFGQQVEAEIKSMPGEVFTGRVAFIDPTVNAKTRTVKIRVEVMNVDGKLRPGDYATARITVPAIPTDSVYDPALSGKFISPMHPQVIRDEPGECPLCGMGLISTAQLGYVDNPLPEQSVVTVPRDAVLRNGDVGIVYVETDPGRFEIRRVSVGPLNDEDAVILQGLSAGETVATGGNFLIDSQMQLAGNPSLMDPSKAGTFAPGPLQFPKLQPAPLQGDSAAQFNRAYTAYFEIQQSLASDKSPPPASLNDLVDSLSQLELLADVPDPAQKQFAIARRSARRMVGTIETARDAYRGVSHAMLRATTTAATGGATHSIYHMYCPMVPGGGGDWMQPNDQLRNPYWGSEMLTCGQVVSRLDTPLEVAP